MLGYSKVYETGDVKELGGTGGRYIKAPATCGCSIVGIAQAANEGPHIAARSRLDSGGGR